MRREIVWSIGLHVAVVLGGALLAPLGTFGDSYSRPIDIISVGLVASAPKGPGPAVPMPKPATPEPALNDAVAIKPETDLNKEEVAPEKPKEETKPKEPEKKPEKKPEEKPRETAKQDTVSTQQLAQAETDQQGTTGSISDGAGSGGDVWGVETDASVNPYYTRGFAAVRNNWRNPATGPRPLKCTVTFHVKRSGEIEDVVLEKSSGNTLFDRQAVRAVKTTATWEQFPRFWEEDEQIIRLEFEYRP